MRRERVFASLIGGARVLLSGAMDTQMLTYQ